MVLLRHDIDRSLSKTADLANAIINAGIVIGAGGFGYERNESGDLENLPHNGSVVIEDDVEIGAKICSDRGTLGNKYICRGVRSDNLVHIAT